MLTEGRKEEHPKKVPEEVEEVEEVDMSRHVGTTAG